MIFYERKNALSTKELEELTNLVTETFDEFVGKDYSEQDKGENTFYVSRSSPF